MGATLAKGLTKIIVKLILPCASDAAATTTIYRLTGLLVSFAGCLWLVTLYFTENRRISWFLLL